MDTKELVAIVGAVLGRLIKSSTRLETVDLFRPVAWAICERETGASLWMKRSTNDKLSSRTRAWSAVLRLDIMELVCWGNQLIKLYNI